VTKPQEDFLAVNPDDAEAAPPAKAKPRAGTFQKGRSGNPAGKRPGTRHKLTVWAEELLSTDVDKVIAKVVSRAKRGDMSAARLILDRIMPVRKGRAAPFKLPPIKTTGDVVTALAAVTAAMAAGVLSPAEAVEIAAVIDLQRRAIETQDLEARLHALEGRFK
jgi:hypothetical protein